MGLSLIGDGPNLQVLENNVWEKKRIVNTLIVLVLLLWLASYKEFLSMIAIVHAWFTSKDSGHGQ